MTGKQRSLTLAEKISILDKAKTMMPMKQRDLAVELNVPRATLQKLISNESKLRVEMASVGSTDAHVLLKKKRQRGGKDLEVEEALLLWFEKATAKKLSINGPILKEKVESLAFKLGKANFKASDGWLHRWKVRNDVVYKRAHSEAQSADKNGADIWGNSMMQQILSEFSPNDIYNADETGLYYRATPDGLLVFRRISIHGSIKAKD